MVSLADFMVVHTHRHTSLAINESLDWRQCWVGHISRSTFLSALNDGAVMA